MKIKLLAALPVAALVGGCYASVGPTFGYRYGEGFTIGAEANTAAFWFVHGGFGAFMSTPKESNAMATTGYGSAGLGYYKPSDGHTAGMDAAWELGGANDHEGGLAFFTRMVGGPNFSKGDAQAAFLVNCLAGVSIIDGGVWFYVTPQVGISTMVLDPQTLK